jgi:hypothetical protein
MTATRVTLGAICLSSSSHFAVMPYSKRIRPVALPPGRARLLTKPAPTGSGTTANTMGTVRLAWRRGATDALPSARSQLERVLTRFLLVGTGPRYSTRTFRPSTQPNSCRPCVNAAIRRGTSGSSAAIGMSTPMRRICSACWASATCGQAAAALPTRVMNSRRFIRPLVGAEWVPREFQFSGLITWDCCIAKCWACDVHCWSRADLLTRLWPSQLRVRSTPDSGHHSDGSELRSKSGLMQRSEVRELNCECPTVLIGLPYGREPAVSAGL